MHFDWYSGTVPAKPDTALDCIRATFPHYLPQPDKPRNGFSHAMQFRFGDDRAIAMQWGDNYVGTFLAASGEYAPSAARFIRSVWPSHNVARADAAEDYIDPEAFKRLTSLGLEIADAHGLKTNHVGDWHRGEAGRSLYIGSRQSPAFLRIYEKGKQLAAQRHPDAHPDHVRVELEVKPNSRGKALLAACTPAHLYGCARWTADLYERLTGLQMPRLAVGTIRRVADDQRTFAHLVAQYGQFLERHAADLGGWDALALTLRDAINAAKPGGMGDGQSPMQSNGLGRGDSTRSDGPPEPESGTPSPLPSALPVGATPDPKVLH